MGPTPDAPPQSVSAQLLNLFDRPVSWLLKCAVVTCFAIMVLMVNLNVFLRYVLNSPLDWSEDLARLMFVSVMFLAMPLAVRSGSHIAIEILTARLPRRLKATVERAGLVVAVATLVIAAYQGSRIAYMTWDELMPTLNLSTGWLYVGLVIGCLLSAFDLLRMSIGENIANWAEDAE